MVDLCFSKKSIPGLEGAFWRFEGIEAANDPALKKEIVQRIKASDKSLGAIAKIIIEEVTRFSDYQRACVKFPVDVGHIRELTEWFPDGKVVHITRDPRALAMSKSNDPSGTAIRVVEHPRLAWVIKKITVWLTIVQYQSSARVHRQFKNVRNYRLFRYEDLLAEPERVLKELCDFIEVDFTAEMLQPQKGQHEHQPSSLTGKRQKGFDPTAATRWRTVISLFDYWLISCFTIGSMKKLDYDPKTHPIFRKPERLQHAAEREAVSRVESARR
jgi:hypothetical protein